MKRLKVKADLENDVADIFFCSSKFALFLFGQDLVSLCDYDVDINTCLVLNNENENDERQIIMKLHKQFANASADKFNTSLQDAGYWKIHFSDVLKDRYINIYVNGDTYLKFKKTVLGLVMCSPLSLNFNDAVTTDLEPWKNGLYIFYVIDVFRRLTNAEFTKDKNLSTILAKRCQYGSEIGSTAAENPWQNGVWEQNHPVVNRCI